MDFDFTQRPIFTVNAMIYPFFAFYKQVVKISLVNVSFV